MDLDHFYQMHLEKVSRSFAFCIPRLRPELRNWVSLSYLLFRVVDTIEDSVWPHPQAQKTVFQQFNDFLATRPPRSKAMEWVSHFPATIPAGERALLADVDILLQQFHDLPFDIRSLMKESLSEMSSGMLHFAEASHVGLRRMSELNQYCFFVAGIVGELLTSLVFRRRLKTDTDEALLLQSHHFGLFLQKINILKDQDGDEKEGRFFVPNRELILASLKKDADVAFAYLRSIPADYQDYKLFCAFCFFLALFSLPYIENSWAAKVVDKIPRALMQRRLSEIEMYINDDARLHEIYAAQMRHLQFPDAELGSEMAPDARALADLQAWFDKSYERTLSAGHLHSLGMV